MASAKVLYNLEKTMNTYKELKKKLEMLSMSVIKIKIMEGNNNSKYTILDRLLEIDGMLDELDGKEEVLLRLVYLEGATFEKASSVIGVSRATAFRMRDRAATKIFEMRNKASMSIPRYA